MISPGLHFHPQIVDDALGAPGLDFEADALGHAFGAESDHVAADGGVAVHHLDFHFLAGKALVTQRRADGEHRAFEHGAGGADVDDADVERNILLPHAHGEYRNLPIAEFLRRDQRIHIAVVGAVADEYETAERQAVELIRNRFERLSDGGAGAGFAQFASAFAQPDAQPDAPRVLIEREGSQLEGFGEFFEHRSVENFLRHGIKAGAAAGVGDAHALGIVEQNGEIGVLGRDLLDVHHRAQQAEQDQNEHRRAQTDEPGLPARRQRTRGAIVTQPDRGDDQQREQPERTGTDAIGKAQRALF